MLNEKKWNFELFNLVIGRKKIPMKYMNSNGISAKDA